MKYLKMTLILICVTLILTGCSEVDTILESAYEDEVRKNEIIGLIKSEKYDEAFESVEAILKENQYNSLEMNEIAYNFLDKKQGEEGVYILQILHTKYPEVDGFRNNLCWGYYLIGQYKMANYFGDLALEVEPNEAIEYVNKGNALYGLDRNEEALEYYNIGYSIDKNEKYILWGRGKCYYDSKKYDEAIINFKEYAKLNPTDEKSTRFYISNSLRNLRKYDEAIKENNGYFQLDKTDTSPLYTIADIYKEDLKQMGTAIEWYKKIIETNGDDAWGYFNMAVCLAEKGDSKEACRNLKKAVALDEEILYDLNYYEEFDKLKSLSAYKEIFK